MMKYSPRLGGILAGLALLLLTFTFFNVQDHESPSSTPQSARWRASRLFRTKGDVTEDINNRTLGFQEVFVISLPDRGDRRDAITLQASVTNMSVTFLDAVTGASVPKKALPHTFDRRPAEVGCWRSHLNVYQHMVKNQIQSALIFEDDADWDVGLRSQLRQVSEGTRWLLGEDDHVPSSPYGDKWHMLWIGHMGITTNPWAKDFTNRRWVIPKDPTVPPPYTERSIGFKADMSTWESGPDGDPQTRIMFLVGMGYGLAGYALTLAGAEKVLYEASLLPFNDPIDTGLGHFCEEMRSGLTCVGSYPSVIGSSKSAGPVAKGSDIQNPTNPDVIFPKAISERTVFSTRLNLKRILNRVTEYESQYPNSTGEVMTMDQIGSGVGYGWTAPVVDASV